MLTPRQLEIARLVARGYTTKAIAAELRISPHTVNDRIQEAAGRLGAPTRPRNALTVFVLTLQTGGS